MAIRASSSGTITFGLVAIPVRFFLAVAKEDIQFNQFTSKGSRVSQQLIEKSTGRVVPKEEELQKGYEYTRGQFVTFTKDEIKSLEADTDKSITIEACVPATSVDLFQIERSYYLGPDKGADRAFGLLVKVLAESGKAAVAQWSTRGREHLVLIRSYRGALLLHTLYYSDEVRNVAEVTDAVATFNVSPEEEELARMLIDRMSAPRFDVSTYRDRYRERVLEAVNAKVAGKAIVVPEASPAPLVIDLMEALKKSLAEGRTGRGRRPTRAEGAAARPSARKRAAKK
jgi:DNA end-binding protein Ku